MLPPARRTELIPNEPATNFSILYAWDPPLMTPPAPRCVCGLSYATVACIYTAAFKESDFHI
jgi:hypothetical protein